MDLATILGLIGAFAFVVLTMVQSGGVGMFVDMPSVTIVFGGSTFAVMAKFGMGQFLSAGKVAGKSFTSKLPDLGQLIDEIVELADVARKGGLLALEGKEVSYPFLQRGIQLLVDGHDPEVVKSVLSNDRDMAEERHTSAAQIFSAFATMGPAMGMIGTLIGLVAMLGNMDDPKSIGPAMAVALLTTLYGALVANCLCDPIADKLKLRAAEESLAKSLVIDALLAVQAGQNPRVIDGLLRTYLAESKREVKEA